MKHVIIFSFLFASCAMQSSEPVTTKLFDTIYKVNNQTFYGEAVHTYIIELTDKLLWYDIPTWSEELEKFLTAFNKPSYAVLSHGSCGIDDAAKWQKRIKLKVYLHQGDKDHPWLMMKPDSLFSATPYFADNIKVIHTPGHSPGSICVLETTTKTLFTGDTFMPLKTGEIEDFTRQKPEDYEDFTLRIRSCKELAALDFENVLPFHYSILLKEGKKSLQKFISDK